MSLEPESLRDFPGQLQREPRTTLAGFISSPDGDRLSLRTTIRKNVRTRPLGKTTVTQPLRGKHPNKMVFFLGGRQLFFSSSELCCGGEEGLETQ